MAYVPIPARRALRSVPTDLLQVPQYPTSHDALTLSSPYIPHHLVDHTFMNSPQLHGVYPHPPALIPHPQMVFPVPQLVPAPVPASRNSMSSGAVSVMDLNSQQAGLAPSRFSPEDLPPFENPTPKFGPANYGVIRIKNIPYSVTKAEISHFLGRYCPLIRPHMQGNPIHIIMERSTAKTMDCFVEVATRGDAEDQVRRHENLIASGKPPKLGTRHVGLEVSNIDQLLTDLFPRAKSINWTNGKPIVVENTDPYSAGFQGFFTMEEMVGMARHADNPQRSPFSTKCLQRTYECMISTLYKFPWFATDLFSLNDRNMLLTTYIHQLKILVEKVGARETVGLDHKLLMDFIFSGMNCPGFGERHKFDLVNTAGRWGGGVNMSYLNCWWPFEAVTRKMVDANGRLVDDQMVRLYLHFIEKGVQTLITSNETPDKSPFPFSNYITFQLPSDDGSEGRYVLRNTRFSFTPAAGPLSYGTVMHMEMVLMELLLATGWEKWQTERGFTLVPMRMPSMERLKPNVSQSLAENMQMLEIQKREVEQHEKVTNAPGAEDKGSYISEDNHGQTPKKAIMQMKDATPQSQGTNESDLHADLSNNEHLSQTPRVSHHPFVLATPHSNNSKAKNQSMSVPRPSTTRSIDPTSAPFSPARPRFLSVSESSTPTQEEFGPGAAVGSASNDTQEITNPASNSTIPGTPVEGSTDYGLGQGLGNGDFTPNAGSCPFITPRKKSVRIQNPDGSPATLHTMTAGKDDGVISQVINPHNTTTPGTLNGPESTSISVEVASTFSSDNATPKARTPRSNISEQSSAPVTMGSNDQVTPTKFGSVSPSSNQKGEVQWILSPEGKVTRVPDFSPANCVATVGSAISTSKIRFGATIHEESESESESEPDEARIQSGQLPHNGNEDGEGHADEGVKVGVGDINGNHKDVMGGETK